MQNKIPEGATHKHEGSGNFLPHYIKVDGNITYTWLTGFHSPDCWNHIPVPDNLENYIELERGSGDE